MSREEFELREELEHDHRPEQAPGFGWVGYLGAALLVLAGILLIAAGLK